MPTIAMLTLLLVGTGLRLAGEIRDNVPSDVLTRLDSVMRSYLRDTAEIPLNVKSTVTFLSSNGKSTRRKEEVYTFEASGAATDSDGIVHEKVTLKGVRTHMMAEQLDTNHTAVMSALAVESGARQSAFAFTYSRSPDADTITLSYWPATTCQAFVVAHGKWRLQEWCGTGEIVFAADSFTPLRSKFRAQGLPISAGKEVLRSYSVEQSYQTVTTASGTKPFLLPKKITAVYETNRGTTTIENEFEPPPGP
ncbi:MAG: hypothetical protein LAO06_15635 [Acidobacteriia bacterium]|nr:hypothetical protein [Terriglobia bacterium]